MQLKTFLSLSYKCNHHLPLTHCTIHLKWVLNVFLPIVMLFILVILNELRMDQVRGQFYCPMHYLQFLSFFLSQWVKTMNKLQLKIRTKPVISIVLMGDSFSVQCIILIVLDNKTLLGIKTIVNFLVTFLTCG